MRPFRCVRIVCWLTYLCMAFFLIFSLFTFSLFTPSAFAQKSTEEESSVAVTNEKSSDKVQSMTPSLPPSLTRSDFIYERMSSDVWYTYLWYYGSLAAHANNVYGGYSALVDKEEEPVKRYVGRINMVKNILAFVDMALKPPVVPKAINYYSSTGDTPTEKDGKMEKYLYDSYKRQSGRRKLKPRMIAFGVNLFTGLLVAYDFGNKVAGFQHFMADMIGGEFKLAISPRYSIDDWKEYGQEYTLLDNQLTFDLGRRGEFGWSSFVVPRGVGVRYRF